MNIFLGQVTIPPDWTSDQALAVVEFLDDISTVIWEIHEQKLLHAMNKRESLLVNPIPDEDEGRPLKPEDDLYFNRKPSSLTDDDYPF